VIVRVYCIYLIVRVAVLDHAGNAVGIITQSKLIKHFAPHVKHFDFGNSTVEILNLGHR
jgi:hypothetical protein